MKDLPEINLTCKISKMSEKHMDKCVDLFIDVFSRPPWNDTFDSREQVVRFFRSHMQNNYFVGFVLEDQEDIMAMSLGFKKPWINGMEYLSTNSASGPKCKAGALEAIFSGSWRKRYGHQA